MTTTEIQLDGRTDTSTPVAMAHATVDSTVTAPRSRRPLRRRVMLAAAGLLSCLGLLTTQATAAHATVTVAGHTFLDSNAACGNGVLSVQVVGEVGNNNDPTRWVMVWVYDPAVGRWVPGPWHQMTAWMTGINDFTFSHHGYYTAKLEYAVSTASGWVYGVDTFKSYSQIDQYGLATRSSYCYI